MQWKKKYDFTLLKKLLKKINIFYRTFVIFITTFARDFTKQYLCLKNTWLHFYYFLQP